MGHAQLETSELIFRGDFRLVVPFERMTEVNASEGKLLLVYPGGRLTLELGAQAEKWANKIRTPKSLSDKLGVKPGARVAMLGLNDEGLLRDLRARQCALSTRMDPNAALIFLAAESRRDLDRLGAIRRAMKRDASVWVVRPKGVAAITERDVMQAGKDAGLVDVKVVRFSVTHTAEKFVIRVADR